jgi:CRISPR/Cas system-associated exonuclease Cas4 (RecB family)
LDYAIFLKQGVYKLKSGFILQADKEGTYIIDLKSGSKSGIHRMQVSAYAAAYEEMTQEKIAGGLIVYTNGKKAGGAEQVETIFMDRARLVAEFEDFKHVLSIWNREHANDSPVRFKFPSIITME